MTLRSYFKVLEQESFFISFLYKGPESKYLGFQGHRISLPTIQLSLKAQHEP